MLNKRAGRCGTYIGAAARAANASSCTTCILAALAAIRGLLDREVAGFGGDSAPTDRPASSMPVVNCRCGCVCKPDRRGAQSARTSVHSWYLVDLDRDRLEAPAACHSEPPCAPSPAITAPCALRSLRDHCICALRSRPRSPERRSRTRKCRRSRPYRIHIHDSVPCVFHAHSAERAPQHRASPPNIWYVGRTIMVKTG